MADHDFKAMILAAGRGERMRPLTDVIPKPLLRVGNKMLIEYHLESLALAGFKEIVINHAYLGHMIENALGDGTRYGLTIQYSKEIIKLETAGGIANALPLLTINSPNSPFLVVNSDIYCSFDFSTLLSDLQRLESKSNHDLAHLILVCNPPHHPEGDFCLSDQNRITPTGSFKLTFSGIGIYLPQLFKQIPLDCPTRLAPLLHQAIANHQVSGRQFSGEWFDIGTPDRLHELNQQLQTQQT